MEKLLTIGVPTYNRAGILVELIQTLVKQIETCALRERVEILISDDRSQDNPRLRISGFLDAYPDMIKFRENERNLGFSPNFDAAVRYATGKFVLLMANDDGLEDDALLTIVRALDSHPDIGMAYFDSRVWDSKLSRPCSSFTSRPNQFFERGMDFAIREKSYTPCLISGYVVNRRDWMDTRPERFYSSITIQIPVAMLILAKRSFYWHHETPIVRYRSANGTWSPSNDSIYPFPLLSGYLDACNAVENHYPARTVRALYWSITRTIIGHTIRNKVLGLNFNRKAITAFLEPSFNYNSAFTKLCTVLMKFVFAIPRWCIYVPFRWLVPKTL